jgi:hypothetical protein
LKAAEAQVRAAEKSRGAARAERLPSLALSADRRHRGQPSAVARHLHGCRHSARSYLPRRKDGG